MTPQSILMLIFQILTRFKFNWNILNPSSGINITEITWIYNISNHQQLLYSYFFHYNVWSGGGYVYLQWILQFSYSSSNICDTDTRQITILPFNYLVCTSTIRFRLVSYCIMFDRMCVYKRSLIFKVLFTVLESWTLIRFPQIVPLFS